MAATRASLNRSQTMPAGETPGIEYFWATKLDASKKSFTWTVKDDALEEDDEDFINHTLFIKTAVLGAEAVDDQSNVVMMESLDCENQKVEGAILHLKKGSGGSLMCPLDLSISGKQGATFTLIGDGPIYISGNYLQEYPKEDPLDNTQTEGESDESCDELNGTNGEMEDEEESEEQSGKKEEKKETAAKRKGSTGKDKKGEKGEEDMEAADDGEDAEDQPPKKNSKKESKTPESAKPKRKTKA